jgi:mycothiol synthase
MLTPAYRDAVDLAVFAADGSVAAFCIAWTDDVSRVGLLEPVGCHPDHRRRGLGRALLHRAFDALAERGMREVMVLAEDGGPAERFYQEAGLRPTHRVLNYVRDG